MTDRYAACTEACEAMPDCVVCGRRKSPVGRSVAPETASGYCDDDCEGYRLDPKPGHLWPGELLAELEARAKDR